MLGFLSSNWDSLFTLLGMGLAVFGASRAAYAILTTPKKAGEDAVSRIASDDPSDWKKMPLAHSQVRASDGAMTGFALIAVGTVFQAVPIIVDLLL